jgi:hypothetical protein
MILPQTKKSISLSACWAFVLTGLLFWAFSPRTSVAWDLGVYGTGARSILAGRDPYADGMAVQRIFHAGLIAHPKGPPPMTYVYPPITLPVLKLLAGYSWAGALSFYCLSYLAAYGSILWFSYQFATEVERRWLKYFMPFSLIFPGLLLHNVILSGNIATVIYGAVLGSMLLGWRRGLWLAFYVAVVSASALKPPLLTLLAIPFLLERRHLPRIAFAVAVSFGLLFFELKHYPVFFAHFVEANELQFSFNHDFGASPAGLLADALFDVVPYKITGTIFYLFYLVIDCGLLLYFRRKFLAGRISFIQWAPVMLLGVLLLNPRIMEYDIAPFTIMMALVAWRLTEGGTNQTAKRGLLAVSLIFGNVVARFTWRPTDCMILVLLFGAGCWMLSKLWRSHAESGPRCAVPI